MIDLDSWAGVQFAPPVVSGELSPERFNAGNNVKKWCDENCKGKAMIDNVVGDVCQKVDK